MTILIHIVTITTIITTITAAVVVVGISEGDVDRRWEWFIAGYPLRS